MLFSNNYVEYENNADKDKKLSIEEYLDKIRPYLSDIVNNHKTQGEWKIQLTIAINLISSKDSNEAHTMHSKSNNIKIVIGYGTDEIIKELFESLLQKYQKGIKERMIWSEFVFDSVDLLYYKLHKIILNRGGSYIDSTKWLKTKEAKVNPKNNEHKCFQYAASVALSHENIEKNLQRVSKIQYFINQYNWEKINFPSHK